MDLPLAGFGPDGLVELVHGRVIQVLLLQPLLPQPCPLVHLLLFSRHKLHRDVTIVLLRGVVDVDFDLNLALQVVSHAALLLFLTEVLLGLLHLVLLLVVRRDLIPD